MAGTRTEGDVLEIIRLQTRQFEQLEAENQALRAEIVRLKKKIEELERKKHSKYAAPFSRKTRKADPQPPGLRAGTGLFAHKAPPEPEQVQAVISVPTPNTCTNCGYTGELVFKQMDKVLKHSFKVPFMSTTTTHSDWPNSSGIAFAYIPRITTVWSVGRNTLRLKQVA